MRRWAHRLLCACVLGLGFAAVGAAHAAGKTDVAISIHAGIHDHTLIVRGQATVPDGAWIIYAAYVVAHPQTRVRGYAAVAHRRFAARVDIAGWPPGRIAVDAHFQVLLPNRRQPDAVVALYGPKGEKMKGGSVVQGGEGFRAAIASAIVENR